MNNKNLKIIKQNSTNQPSIVENKPIVWRGTRIVAPQVSDKGRGEDEGGGRGGDGGGDGGGGGG